MRQSCLSSPRFLLREIRRHAFLVQLDDGFVVEATVQGDDSAVALRVS